MSRSFVIALVALGVLLAIGGAAGYWVMHNDRNPPPSKQTTVSDLTAAESELPKSDLGIGDTVYLTASEPGAGTLQAVPVTVRELIRQAFLLAARDEVGLSTRDVMLREEFPAKPDAKSFPFRLSASASGTEEHASIDFELGRGPADLWRLSEKIDAKDPNPKWLATVAEKAEALSRGEFKGLLTRSGGKGTVCAARASSDVPGATSDLLWTWNEISVLGGLRRVHAEIRDKGESPQLLAALVVGYANLGSLTEYHYSGSHKVYDARALLYAERLLRKTDESSWARWHRAYARMLLELHNLAAEDIAEAKKKQSSSPSMLPLPFWTDLLDTFGRGQSSQMLKLAKTPPQRRLARYLYLQSVMYGPLYELTVKAANDFLEACPDSPFGYQVLASTQVLGPGREGADKGLAVTGALLRLPLLDVPGLPAPTIKRIKNAEAPQNDAGEVEFRKLLIADLKRGGMPQLDRGEPSLCAVGHAIDDIHFAQVVRKLDVYRNLLGLPVDDMIAAIGPLVADHPYAAYMVSFTDNKPANAAAAATFGKKAAMYDITPQDLPILRWASALNPRLGHWPDTAALHGDMVFSDEMLCVQAGFYGAPDAKNYNPLFMQRLRNTSNTLPLAVAMQIMRDWVHAGPQADKYERDYADDPLVTHALIDRYYRLKRYDDAERCAQRYVTLEPGYLSFRVLANVYKAKKDHRRWKETLDKAIKLPPAGLEQAMVQNEIAIDLLERQKWKEAATYADAAAESASSWSMMTAARCHEMLGEWKKAEELVKAVSSHYDDHVMNWMCWCHRTGRGNVRAADEFVHDRIDAWGKTLFPEQARQIGFYCLILGQAEQALDRFQSAQQAKPEFYSAFHAALVADSLGKTGERDKLLEEILKMPPQNAQYEAGTRYKQLAAQLKPMLAPENARFNVAAVDKILASSPSTIPASALPYFVGVFLKNRGDIENAKKYLIRCAQATDWEGVEHTCACQLLREMKVEIPPAEVPADDDPPKNTAPTKAPAEQKSKAA
jgi:tetratricopeptide (TPR) repeat protein